MEKHQVTQKNSTNLTYPKHYQKFYSFSDMPRIPKLNKKIHHISANTISYKRTQMLKTEQFFVFTPKQKTK